MPGAFSNQGELITADLIQGGNVYPLSELVLRLFKNDYTPVDGSVETDFVEADFSGYVAIALNKAYWVIDPDAPTVSAYPVQRLESDADQTLQNIYGYYLTRVADGLYMFGERFSTAPVAVVNNLDYVEVTPKYYLKKQGE